MERKPKKRKAKETKGKKRKAKETKGKKRKAKETERKLKQRKMSASPLRGGIEWLRPLLCKGEQCVAVAEHGRAVVQQVNSVIYRLAQ